MSTMKLRQQVLQDVISLMDKDWAMDVLQAFLLGYGCASSLSARFEGKGERRTYPGIALYGGGTEKSHPLCRE